MSLIFEKINFNLNWELNPKHIEILMVLLVNMLNVYFNFIILVALIYKVSVKLNVKINK